MATPSKKAGDSDPLRRAYDFNPLHTTWSPLHSPRPFSPLCGASDLAPEPAIVPGEPALIRTDNRT